MKIRILKRLIVIPISMNEKNTEIIEEAIHMDVRSMGQL
jgi:hypothetical protein